MFYNRSEREASGTLCFVSPGPCRRFALMHIILLSEVVAAAVPSYHDLEQSYMSFRLGIGRSALTHACDVKKELPISVLRGLVGAIAGSGRDRTNGWRV